MTQLKHSRSAVLPPELSWLIEKNADGILVIDHDGVVRFANSAAEKILGRSRDALVDTPVGIPIVLGQPSEITILRPGLGAIEVEIRVAETSWGGAPALLVSTRDVTARRTVEQELRQTQTLEAIGQLTAAVAHDFNNILTSIMGNLELALSSAADEHLARQLNNAVRASERATQLIDQLLAFARKQDLHIQPTDLNELVGAVEEIFARILPPALQVSRSLDDSLWMAAADPSRIEASLLNLMINARDAMPNGGALAIATRNVGTDDADRPADLPPGRFVALSVSDSGTGMSDRVKAKAFEPFFTTKEVGKGAGLGLSTVYRVLRQLGGLVTIDSALGEGTRVTLYLPRAEEFATPEAARRILVVDDDNGVREVMRLALESQGYAIVDVENGYLALDLLRSGENFGMLITDMAMPGLRGSELVAETRRLQPDLPILIITGYDPGEIGADQPLLRKPFRAAELVARIADCLGQPPPPASAMRHLASQRVGVATDSY
jgi:signal transduction histidine kinase